VDDDEESRCIEHHARKDLEADGCPSCYPISLEVPLRDVPERYKGVTSYWQSLPGTGDVVLCAQRTDWERFRESQLKRRQDSGFEDSIWIRRRNHGLGERVQLRPDPAQQTRLENWFEFQDYHLDQHERLERRQKYLEDKLEAIRRDGEDQQGGPTKGDRLGMLETVHRQLGLHNHLLRWIEDERLVMASMHCTPVAPVEPVKSLEFDFRRLSRNVRKILGDVVTVDPDNHEGNTVHLKRKVPTSQPAGLKHVSMSWQSGSSRLRPRLKHRPQGAGNKAELLRPRSQRPHKAIDVRPKVLQGTQPPLPPPVVKTRSGRVSRKPVRWTPCVW